MTWVLYVKNDSLVLGEIVKWDCHFTVTLVLIVKTEYFAAPRNRKVEHQFQRDQFLVGKSQ